MGHCSISDSSSSSKNSSRSLFRAHYLFVLDFCNTDNSLTKGQFGFHLYWIGKVSTWLFKGLSAGEVSVFATFGVTAPHLISPLLNKLIWFGNSIRVWLRPIVCPVTTCFNLFLSSSKIKSFCASLACFIFSFQYCEKLQSHLLTCYCHCRVTFR